jgi:hypothetical protein
MEAVAASASHLSGVIKIEVTEQNEKTEEAKRKIARPNKRKIVREIWVVNPNLGNWNEAGSDRTRTPLCISPVVQMMRSRGTQTEAPSSDELDASRAALYKRVSGGPETGRENCMLATWDTNSLISPQTLIERIKVFKAGAIKELDFFRTMVELGWNVDQEEKVKTE